MYAITGVQLPKETFVGKSAERQALTGNDVDARALRNADTIAFAFLRQNVRDWGVERIIPSVDSH
jgi:hypothetical protein